MVKKVTYAEPKNYFSPAMKKAASDWDKANKAKTTQSSKGKKESK